jgi:hypothetical protein
MKTSARRQGQRSAVLYEICADTDDGLFQPMGFMSSDKQEALAELRETRERHPRAYVATVTYRRCVAPKRRERRVTR